MRKATHAKQGTALNSASSSQKRQSEKIPGVPLDRKDDKNFADEADDNKAAGSKWVSARNTNEVFS